VGRLAVERLNRLVVAEGDPLVWHGVLAAVAGDPSEASVRLGYAAISHPSPEVRRRACLHLAAHGSPRHVKVLVPALEDANHSVVCAAVRALGAAGRMDDTSPLKRLAQNRNEEIRLETAIALVRLGDVSGEAALERLAYSRDPKIRRRVAVAMGETARPSFLPTLIRLLDDQRMAVRRAALAGLPKLVGGDMVGSNERWPAGTTERIRRWKQWYEQRAASPGPPQR